MLSILTWFTSSEGRIAAAGLLFVCMWAIKNVPIVEEKVLTTPRLRQLATALMALGPAVALLADSTVPFKEVLLTAVSAFGGATGLHAAIKVLASGSLAGPAVPPPLPGGKP